MLSSFQGMGTAYSSHRACYPKFVDQAWVQTPAWTTCSFLMSQKHYPHSLVLVGPRKQSQESSLNKLCDFVTNELK